MIYKIVIRNLRKRPFLNLIKIIGLSLALTGIIFIVLFLKNEKSYDRFHKNSDRIYRITTTHPNFLGEKHFARAMNTWYLKGMKEELPELEEYVRLAPIRGGVMFYNDKYYNISQGFECDSTFFNLFDAELIMGNKKTVFDKPGSMLVTESFAKRVFGTKNPIGEILTVPSGQFYPEPIHFTVNAVMKDFPSNSHFHPDFLASPVNNKFNGWAYTYLLLSENANPDKITKGFVEYLAKEDGKKIEEIQSKAYLQKITDIHLHSHKLREIESNGNIINSYVLAIAALILLLVSISNYANLNIGMAGFYSKYLTVDKLLGSSKWSVVKYFFIEGSFVVTLAIVLSVIFTIPVNSLITKVFGLHLVEGNWPQLLMIILSFFLLSVLFGMLPVLKPVFSFLTDRLSNKTASEIKGGSFSSGLVVFQYAFSIALIIAVVVIIKQTDYAFKKGIGIQDDNVICFEAVHANVQKKFELFKSELLKYGSIDEVSAMLEPPGGEANDMFKFEMEGYKTKKENREFDRIGVFPCDFSFAALFKLDFISGENFSKNNKDNEGSGEYIINKAALHRLNYSSADDVIGKSFNLIHPYPDVQIPKGKIIGVVDDFHISSLKKGIEPLVMFKRDKQWLLNFVVSYKPGMKQIAMSNIKEVWTKLYPEYSFQYEHVSSLYKTVYRSELLQGRLLSIFTITALFICSMGLLGLALIITQHRTKEIGVRKVNGARISDILTMLNKGFVRLVIIALVIASPLAYYAMNIWLENFAYKTEISWWIFALAGGMAMTIALLTVSWQSWRAASRNPVEALKYE